MPEAKTQTPPIKIKRLVYRRAANLGDFESVHFEVETEISTEQKTSEAYMKLREFVEKAIDFEIEQNKTVKRNDRGARV